MGGDFYIRMPPFVWVPIPPEAFELAAGKGVFFFIFF